MGFGQILVLAFVAFNFFAFIWKQIFPKDSTKSGLSRLMSAVFAGTFLFAFIRGYLFTAGAFVPLFINFAGNLMFWKQILVIIILATILNIILVKVFPGLILQHSSADEKETAAKYGTISRIFGPLVVSLQAGLTEEYLYRFILFTTIQPLVFLVAPLFNLGFLVSLVPGWLTLSSGIMFAAPVFVAALIVNVMFAYPHHTTNISKHMWHRVIAAWFLGWITFQALIFYGFLGAVVIHFLVDFVLLVPVSYFSTKLLADAYWKEKYGF